jgi:hypothetical protein
VNNAGIFTGLHTIVDETEDEYDRTMAVNGKRVWLGCSSRSGRCSPRSPSTAPVAAS